MINKRECEMQPFKSVQEGTLLSFTYFVGLLLAALFFIGDMFAIVRVMHPEHLPQREKNMIIAVNHKGFWGAFITPILFFKEWFLHPRRWGPWSTPDAANFRKSQFWFFRLAAGRAILVPRGDRHGLRRAFTKITAVLKNGGRVVIFPEGGRTSSHPTRLMSPKGRGELRPLTNGVGMLARRSGASILPIWIETAPLRQFFRKPPIMVKVGRLMRFSDNMSPEEITEAVQATMLALADE